MLTKRAPFSFTWGFTLTDDITLHSCTAVGIDTGRDESMNDATVQPSPPYTMIAYPENGVPIASPLGSTGKNMQWVPQFAAGTKVLLNVVDSLGNSGGVSRVSYIVGSGPAGCVPSNSNSNLKITITSSGNSLQTCDTLPIRIEGGTKPYTISLASTDSNSAFNTTLDASNDYFQWINKAPPNQELIASVSDSTGRYAVSSQIFNTAGATDTSCLGKQDAQSVFGGTTSSGSSGTSLTSSSPSSSATATPGDTPGKSSKNLTGAIIGTIVAMLVIFGIIAYFFFRRRNQRHGGDSPGGGGFGLMEYKRGANLPGHDDFIPLKDHDASPSAAKMPLYGGDQFSPSTATNSFNGPRNRQSGFDYYSNPPSTLSGTNTLVQNTAPPNPMAVPTIGLGVGAAATGPSPAHQSKHQMMLEERQRQQQVLQQRQPGWPTAAAPPSVYPPISSYTVTPPNPANSVNPFGDNTYPYNPSAAGTSAYGHNPNRSVGSDLAYGHNPTRSAGGDIAYGAPPPSQQNPVSSMGTSSASGSQGARVLTAAERAKAAEAAQERRAGYDDDDDPIPYMQQTRLVLGVTNPDRHSVATTNTTTSDAYGGIASSAPPQVIQHEDAGEVIELPPAYREFSKTPGPGT
ncbi:hypothetical protein FS842_003734 [Serendipita sp. 407]|nr:hypothetical protein FS842_003734 [Serendipita sp. 407]